MAAEDVTRTYAMAKSNGLISTQRCQVESIFFGLAHSQKSTSNHT